MRREQCYLSTMDANAHKLARRYGLGLEIAEYCTASNMDDRYPQTDAAVREKLTGIPNRVLHAPFNELFPCAIDPKARELARCRYRQAIALAQSYGAAKVVIHGGYHPRMYFPCWYTEQSIPFWRDFLETLPDGITICLENVLEEEPGMLLDIVKAVDDPRLRICLDTGHANVYSGLPVLDWLEACASQIGHFHIHNNAGDYDAHQGLMTGAIPMAELLGRAAQVCPDATYTLEMEDTEPSVLWLRELFLRRNESWKPDCKRC